MFSALTQPNYPKAALGLEKDSVTALALQKEGRGQYGIKQAATVELPNRLLNPNFLEKNIADSAQLNTLIDETLINAGLVNQKNWSVSLPSNAARTAILTLESEPVSKQELSEILDWKSEQVFGASAGEMRISREKISPDSEGKTRYFATAVKLSVINEYETLFEMKGWKTGLILPRVVSESNWLMNKDRSDSLLISSQFDGFTALLLRGNEPTVVRNVTCGENERDDEIFRLLMFYRDRLANEQNWLEKILLIGKDFAPQKIHEISAEALGQTLKILRPEDVGLNIPANNLNFDDLAAPAGLAALGI
ncbi:MAG TPA: hypothetical protein PKY59_23145 [Pyrinomonadaceae bacterium]|nr:hypothetical protein [Pyrinomonadaceae bacterium]